MVGLKIVINTIKFSSAKGLLRVISSKLVDVIRVLVVLGVPQRLIVSDYVSIIMQSSVICALAVLLRLTKEIEEGRRRKPSDMKMTKIEVPVNNSFPPVKFVLSLLSLG